MDKRHTEKTPSLDYPPEPSNKGLMKTRMSWELTETDQKYEKQTQNI